MHLALYTLYFPEDAWQGQPPPQGTKQGMGVPGGTAAPLVWDGATQSVSIEPPLWTAPQQAAEEKRQLWGRGAALCPQRTSC